MFWNIGKIVSASIISAFLISGCATSAKIPVTPIKQPIEIDYSKAKDSKPIQFKKIVVKLSRGEHIGAIEAGLFCVPHSDLKWRGSKMTLNSDVLTEIFREELEKANYKVVGDPDALFEDPSEWKAEILIAGLVKELKGNICYPYGGFGNWTSSKGEGYMKVEWQIYSRLDRKVIHKVTTEASSIQTETSDNPDLVWENSFALNIQNLLADKKFNEIVTSNKRYDLSVEKPLNQEKIFINCKKEKTLPINESINEVKASIVTIYANSGHGSGFFIDGNGYVLTNQHVVGEAKFVKIKLATGREVLGEVIRRNNYRDIALIKTQEQNFISLPIRKKDLSISSEVYAVGSPLDEKLDSTISKGIVSSYRDVDGLKYIQSDVNVLPGNSGGPLLDNKGNVIGVTVQGIMLRGGMADVNFFIPIHDAFKYLQIEQKI